MYGSMIGNVVAILFFFAFQLVGLSIAIRILKHENRSFQVLIGSVLGSFGLHWLPTIFSMFMGFNQESNLLGLIIFAVIGMVVHITYPHTTIVKSTKRTITRKEWIKIIGIWILIIPTFLFFLLTLVTHTLMMENGAMYAGQCSYGDMNLHLGIITSIANQGSFPPNYSIFPGAKLSYPFLSDSISSSLYIFGASLKISYIVPMLFAILQVLFGFYMFAYGWFKKKSIAILAWILFFFNGGFGFFYFLDGAVSDPTKFTRIFTEFYETPTNLIGSNIRWVNVIVDMLIPQRATLFGYAMLFPIMCMLYKAVFENQRKYFVISAVLISGLPMIHTHSFLVIGLICAGWLLYSLYQRYEKREEWTAKDKKVLLFVLLFSVLIMEAISLNSEKVSTTVLFLIPIVIILLLIIMGFWLLYKQCKDGNGKVFLQTWCIFLIILIVPVLWQLFTWTFKQASEGGFLKGHFNWVNTTDSYIWFYLKNVGLVGILTIPAILKAGKKHFYVTFPALLIWLICEFIVFQPNEYDNNKLLYPAYAFICCIVANYMISIYHDLKEKNWKKTVAVFTVVVCTTSAILTMIREINSKYELYNNNQVKLSEFIEINTPVDSIILTDTRHNNAISSLTGRNIVCGTGSFLYYHGIDYSERLEEVNLIYQDAIANQSLIEKNNIDYILVGPEERATFVNLNEEAIKNTYDCIYSEGELSLYEVSD